MSRGSDRLLHYEPESIIGNVIETRRIRARTRPEQPWLLSARFDLTAIAAPPMIAAAIASALPRSNADVGPLAWFAIVVCIDVAHVYGTIFRTYLDPVARQERRLLLYFAPILCWITASVLYGVGELIFWRALAYLAVIHFVRQQYGFVRLYGRSDEPFRRRLDSVTVYTATIYPLVYWHTHLPRSFAWFVEGDFVPLPAGIDPIARWFYFGVLTLWSAVTLIDVVRDRWINLPKTLIIAGTAASWWVGIVAFDGDLVFTLTNVVAHGVPYLALIWAYEHKRSHRPAAPRHAALFRSLRTASLFIGLLIALAWIEEGLWDGLVWRQHLDLFPGFSALANLETHSLMRLIVPLLAVPQATHYVMDAFLWRMREKGSVWKRDLFGAANADENEKAT